MEPGDAVSILTWIFLKHCEKLLGSIVKSQRELGSSGSSCGAAGRGRLAANRALGGTTASIARTLMPNGVNDNHTPSTPLGCTTGAKKKLLASYSVHAKGTACRAAGCTQNQQLAGYTPCQRTSRKRRRKQLLLDKSRPEQMTQSIPTNRNLVTKEKCFKGNAVEDTRAAQLTGSPARRLSPSLAPQPAIGVAIAKSTFTPALRHEKD